MKEAFWGVLIVMLGLLGIVILQVFQNITITNDQTYYLLKEATEASMLDSIDLAYYRTKGKIKIVKDKFVENLARRFAQSANINDNYDIVVHDIIEEPPKISLSIGAYVFSLKGDTFNIGQSISSIIESKYNSTTIGETPVTPPVDPPEEPDDGSCPVCNEGDPNCSPVLECIPGDLRFKNWDDDSAPLSACPTVSLKNVNKTANYESCECGKWKGASDSVPSVITKTSTNYTYTWHFLKSSVVRTLDLTATKTGSYDVCVTEIPLTIGCPGGKRSVEKGNSFQITPTYIPPEAVNRGLEWTSSNTNVATVQFPKASTVGPKGVSVATVTGIAKGESTITARSSNDKTASCDVSVTDGLICENETIPAGGKKTLTLAASSPKPSGLTWSIPNGSSIATINGSTGEVTVGETATTIDYVVSAPGYNPATCHITITDEDEEKPTPTGCTPGSISVKWDTTRVWPNKTGPTMCPQYFEYINGNTPVALSKLGILKNKVSYCGYYGGYRKPEKASWDKSDTFESTYYSGAESLGSNTYSVTYRKRFNYEGWNTDVGPYTRGVGEVVKSYTISGTLLKRTDPKCATSGTSTPFVLLECPEGLMSGSSALITADRYNSGRLNDNTHKWNVSGPVSTSNDTATSITIKGTGTGIVTISYTINDIDGKTITSEKACSINVYPKCSDVYITGPSTLDRTDTASYSVQPSLGGESAWSSSNSDVLDITSDTNTFHTSVDAGALKAGTVTIKAVRRIDNCSNSNMKKTVTVRKVYECPIVGGVQTHTYSGNNSYCYHYSLTTYATKCGSNSGYPYLASGYCFKDYSSWYGWYNYHASVTKVSPSVCDLWNTARNYSCSSGSCMCYKLYDIKECLKKDKSKCIT